MWLVDYVSLAIILVIWGASPLLKGRRFSILLVPVLLIGIVLFYVTREQFFLWYGNDVSQKLIPPYSTIYYFIFYVFTRFWAEYLISLIVALIFLGLALYFNKKHGEKFFWPEEPYLLAVAIFLSGHPAWVLYFLFIFVITLVTSSASTFITRRFGRFSFYYFWLPTAAVAVLLNQALLNYWAWYGNLIL